MTEHRCGAQGKPCLWLHDQALNAGTIKSSPFAFRRIGCMKKRPWTPRRPLRVHPGKPNVDPQKKDSPLHFRKADSSYLFLDPKRFLVFSTFPYCFLDQSFLVAFSTLPHCFLHQRFLLSPQKVTVFCMTEHIMPKEMTNRCNMPNAHTIHEPTPYRGLKVKARGMTAKYSAETSPESLTSPRNCPFNAQGTRFQLPSENRLGSNGLQDMARIYQDFMFNLQTFTGSRSCAP